GEACPQSRSRHRPWRQARPYRPCHGRSCPKRNGHARREVQRECCEITRQRRRFVMRSSQSLFAVCSVVFFSVVARADDKPGAVQPIKVVTIARKEPLVYEKDIEPILVNKCAFCHSGAVKESKFDLGSYENLMRGG